MTATITLTPTPEAALITVLLVPVHPAVAAGNKAEISVTIMNSGSLASNVRVWDTIPSDTVFDPLLAENAGWTVSGNVITYDTGSLPSGASLSVSFTITTSSTLPSGDAVDIDPAVCGFDDIISRGRTEQSLPAQVKIGDIVVYPNPFNPETAVGHALKFGNMPKNAIITILTLTGETVTNFNAVKATVYWDGTNAYGSRVAPGVYYYIIRYNDNRSRNIGKIFIIRGK